MKHATWKNAKKNAMRYLDICKTHPCDPSLSIDREPENLDLVEGRRRQIRDDGERETPHEDRAKLTMAEPAHASGPVDFATGHGALPLLLKSKMALSDADSSDAKPSNAREIVGDAALRPKSGTKMRPPRSTPSSSPCSAKSLDMAANTEESATSSPPRVLMSTSHTGTEKPTRHQSGECPRREDHDEELGVAVIPMS